MKANGGSLSEWTTARRAELPVCPFCGSQIIQKGPGRRRKWCSEHCRKRALYSGVCIDCGSRTSGTASGLARRAERCATCQSNRLNAANVESGRAICADVETMWHDGYTLVEIAAEMGWTPNSAKGYICRQRKRGGAFPYRRAITASGQRGMSASGRKLAERRAAEQQAPR